MVKAKKFILAKHFDGFPKDSDLQLVEEELPPLQDGEVLLEAVYLSVDPYMRPYSRNLKEGSTMIGTQVAKVTESKHPSHPVGKHFIGHFGWRDKTVINLKKEKPGYYAEATIVDMYDMGDLSKSLALGILGMTGATAYFGLLRLCEPKPGEVVVVNAAAGAVGSAVGQIAKIKGCTVIGYAGSDEKVAWLKELGFDHAFNYKKTDVYKTLKEVAPDGVDCYFDNVGGDFSSAVIHNMKKFGRMSICGCIDSYNVKDNKYPTGPYPFGQILFAQLRVEGFIVSRWNKEFDVAFKEMNQWIKEGKLKYKEHVTEGFEKMPQAFFGLLKGENTGKAVVMASRASDKSYKNLVL